MALTGDAERAKATLRVSWGPATAERDLDRFSAALVRAIQFLDAHGA
jgi:cysteine sulfinate desulfinase/cysteine desulfurase-like protein